MIDSIFRQAISQSRARRVKELADVRFAVVAASESALVAMELSITTILILFLEKASRRAACAARLGVYRASFVMPRASVHSVKDLAKAKRDPG